VVSIVAMVTDGMSVIEILAEPPDLEADDISESLRYAALAVQEWELPPLRPAWGCSWTRTSHRCWWRNVPQEGTM
jgi:hypothetical protein